MSKEIRPSGKVATAPFPFQDNLLDYRVVSGYDRRGDERVKKGGRQHGQDIPAGILEGRCGEVSSR